MSNMVEARRAMGSTIFFGLLAAGGFGVAGHLALRVAPVAPGAWLGVVVVGVLGLVCALGAVGAQRFDLSCDCGQRIRLDDGADQQVFCKGCKSLLAIEGGRATRLPEDIVAPQPDFGILILPRMKVPAICAACGAESSHSKPFVAKDSAAGATAMALVGSLLSGSLTLVWASAKTEGGVPYCDAHEDGHEVVANEGSFTLWTRSWRFIRGILEANPQMLHSVALKGPNGKPRTFG
jgi:hypothetical protein